MQTALVKFDTVNESYHICFHIILSNEELFRYNMKHTEHIKGYVITQIGNILLFCLIFPKRRLHYNETIGDRLGRIQEDIEHIASSCLV